MELVNKIASPQTNKKNIWAVQSGKGGVGKTFVTSSLALTLSKLQYNVLVIDLDLSGANIHTALGLNPSYLNLRHYLEGNKEISELVIPTPFPKLSYIQGIWDSWLPFNLGEFDEHKFIADLHKLNFDYILIDFGVGPFEKYYNLYLECDEKILVSSPEPTSIEKNYRFIESYICQNLKSKSTPEAFGKLISTLREFRHKTLDKPFSFKTYLKENEGLTLEPFNKLNREPIKLILNGIRSLSVADLGYSIKSVCNKYYGLNVEYIGFLEFDNSVWQSVKNREPVLISQPFTPVAGQFLNICKNLTEPENLRAVV